MFKVDTKKIFLETFVAFVITEENNEWWVWRGLTDDGVCMCAKQSVNNSTEAALTHTHTNACMCRKVKTEEGRRKTNSSIFYSRGIISRDEGCVCVRVCVLVIELPEVS